MGEAAAVVPAWAAALAWAAVLVLAVVLAVLVRPLDLTPSLLPVKGCGHPLWELAMESQERPLVPSIDTIGKG